MSVALDLGVAQDVAFVSSDAPCTRASQLDGGWSCFRASGDQYHGTPQGGRLPLAPARGPTRLVLGAELPFDAFALGARLGWAFRGMGPASDGKERPLPLGVEVLARAKVFESGGFRFDVLALAGVRRVDAYARDTVTEDTSVPPSEYQLDNPPRQTLDAYKRLGTGFVGAGFAASFALAPWSTLRLELPLSLFFPTSGVAVTPSAVVVVTP